MIRYLAVAVVGWIIATAILFSLGAFTAASVNPLDWEAPGRFFVATLSLTAGVVCGAWAYTKIEDYHSLIRLEIAGREASARWNRDWVRRLEVPDGRG